MKQVASFVCCLLHDVFLFGLFFDTEDEGDIFLRYVVLSPNYSVILDFHSNFRENFKSKTENVVSPIM
jgi:hypothetical protein